MPHINLHDVYSKSCSTRDHCRQVKRRDTFLAYRERAIILYMYIRARITFKSLYHYRRSGRQRKLTREGERSSSFRFRARAAHIHTSGVTRAKFNRNQICPARSDHKSTGACTVLNVWLVATYSPVSLSLSLYNTARPRALDLRRAAGARAVYCYYYGCGRDRRVHALCPRAQHCLQMRSALQQQHRGYVTC